MHSDLRRVFAAGLCHVRPTAASPATCFRRFAHPIAGLQSRFDERLRHRRHDHHLSLIMIGRSQQNRAWRALRLDHIHRGKDRLLVRAVDLFDDRLLVRTLLGNLPRLLDNLLTRPGLRPLANLLDHLRATC
jgi:hypothetical protein